MKQSRLGLKMVEGLLWDIADSCETAPSFCFIADRSCCLAAFNEAIANSSSTVLIAYGPLRYRPDSQCRGWRKPPAKAGRNDLQAPASLTKCAARIRTQGTVAEGTGSGRKTLLGTGLPGSVMWCELSTSAPCQPHSYLDYFI